VCFANGMAAPSPRITQVGLGTDEGDEVELIDAWWNPPPTAPVTCPPTAPPASQTGIRRRQTISLEDLEE
jgi:hypothetical protein